MTAAGRRELTCLFFRFLFNSHESTVKHHIKDKSDAPLGIEVHEGEDGQLYYNRKIAIDFWDTAGQERFASMHPSYYYRADACILVFDVTRKTTYQNLNNWYTELRNYCETIPCVCIANKIDVDLTVTKKSFAFPTRNNLPFYYVSAADGTNVVSIFENAIQIAWDHKNSGEKDFVSEVLSLLDEV